MFPVHHIAKGFQGIVCHYLGRLRQRYLSNVGVGVQSGNVIGGSASTIVANENGNVDCVGQGHPQITAQGIAQAGQPRCIFNAVDGVYGVALGFHRLDANRPSGSTSGLTPAALRPGCAGSRRHGKRPAPEVLIPC